jgi:uncharacterized membrane protein
MPDVTREEFDALATRVSALEGKTPVATPPPVAIALTAPTAKVDGPRYYLSATVTAAKATKFAYLQLAVRGPDASDLDRRPGATLAAGASLTLSANAPGAGVYTAWVAYSLDGLVWVDGPKTEFTITPEAAPPPAPRPPGAKVGTGKFSHLPFNSLVFRAYPRDAEEFGRRRGTPVDGLLTFSSRRGWGDFTWVPDGTAAYVQSGHIVVNSMPHAPESEGSAMNQKGANNAYKDQQRAVGKHIKDAGLNVPEYAVRVDWECNGNWYHWSANRAGGGAALREAIKNYIINVRAGGATKVRFDLCFNKGPSQAGHDFDIFPGPEYVDVIGIDQYDMWGPSYSDADWEREMKKSPTVRIAAEFAKKHGIEWSWDEGGNTHGDKNQGGDNPIYWQLRRKEIDRNADNCAWDVSYDHPGAPASLRHDFASNPKSWPVYKKLWTPG